MPRLGIALGFAALIAGTAHAEEIGVRLPTRASVTESFLYNDPGGAQAVLILFAGGEGAIGVSGEGPGANPERNGNFLIRSRVSFATAGFATVALDAPSDRHDGIDEAFRKSAEHAADVSAVVAWLRQKTKAPVWLVGTSMGSISAASVAIRIGSAIDGVVLTSSVSAAGRASPGLGVSTLDLDKIAVPTLVMDHDEDACRSSPPANAKTIAEHLTRAPRKAVVLIEGGKASHADPCGPFSAHGYLGVEDKAVAAIATFVKQK